jgi:hypothetical protein
MRVIVSSIHYRTACGFALLLAGCGPQAPPRVEKPPERPSIARPDMPHHLPTPPGNAGGTVRTGPFAFESEGSKLKFSIPTGWHEQPLSGFLKGIHEAKFKVPTDDGDIEVTFSYTGGGLKANMDRWKGQVRGAPAEQPEESSLKIAGTDATWLDMRGTYTSGAMSQGPPLTGARVIGVGIPLGGAAGFDYYVKLFGPRAAVAKVEADFRAMLRTATRG